MTLPFSVIKPVAWRGNRIGLLGSVMIYASTWFDTDRHIFPRATLILGCSICIVGLLNHIMFLFTNEAKETIWGKGGLIKVAFIPAPWRGMKIFCLGLIIAFLGWGLSWLGVPFVIILFPIGFLIGIIGFYNHLRWMFKGKTEDS